MDTKFTIGSLLAAKACQTHIKASSFSYSPEEAAVDIDAILKLPELLSLIDKLVDEAKKDLASSPNWTGTTVRVSRSTIKELANISKKLSD